MRLGVKKRGSGNNNSAVWREKEELGKMKETQEKVERIKEVKEENEREQI